jgi:glucose/arabinose dehydrogenase
MRPMRILRTCLLACTLGLAHCGGDDGAGGGLPEVRVVDAYPQLTFSQPVFFTQAPGDASRAFVVTLGGTVRVFDHDAAAASSSAYLGLAARVTDAGGELGLLGFAFDPAFATNGFIYANYNPNFDDTGGNPRRTTIARYTAASAAAVSVDPATEAILLEFEQPFDNHNGGWLGFGPDGKLYIASGDGGSGNDPQNNAQNLGNLLGKFLRINADGSIPPDNPFIATGADEIWAYGLRNPYRASFDRTSGELYAGDVGQGEREEVDLIVAGGNYGWRKYEGTRLNFPGDPEPANPIAPIHEYGHGDGSCSIIGGYVYRGAALPGHVGAYFYTDLCTGALYALRPGAGATRVGEVPGTPTSFGEDLDGELYVTSFDGHVYKIVPP